MGKVFNRLAALAALYAIIQYLRRRSKFVHLEDRVVLITGGAKGIGRETAFKFAAAGARVVLWDVDTAGLLATQADIDASGVKHPVSIATVDMSNRDAIYKAAEELKAAVGFVYCVVNNCGVVSGKWLLDTPDSSVERTFQVNALAVIWTTKAFLPAMLERNSGHIVTVSSMASFVGAPKMVDYAGSKFASRGIMDALRNEIARLGATGVHTSCICPGHVSTGLFTGFKTIVPSLSPEFVGARILEAVQKQDTLVLLPWIMHLAIALQGLMPQGIVDFLNRVTGATTAMDTFKGNAIQAGTVDSALREATADST